LDEVQNIDVFQRLVDGLFIKKNVDLYITGSNAYLLSGELATLLTGRYIDTSILPLQFAEYYDFISLKSPNLSKTECLAIYTVEGGVPEYFNQKFISQNQADDFILIYKAPRYEIKGKGLLQTLNKYYLVDPCFRKVRLKRDMKKDISHWLENMVYLELLRRNRDVYVGKIDNLDAINII